MANSRAQRDAGNTAREMAAAPLSPHTNGEERPAGVSPSISEQLRDQAIASSIIDAEKLSKAIQDPENANPFTDLFGPVTFRLPDREGVYKDDRHPTVTNRKMAIASFTLADLVEVDGTIYAREEPKKDEGGAYMETSLSMSLPSAGRQQVFKVPKGRPDVQLMIDAWKYSIVTQYETWLADLQAATPTGRRTDNTGMLPRHIKRTPIKSIDAPK